MSQKPNQESIPLDKVDIDKETLERLKSKETPSPEDYIGAIFTYHDGRQMKIEAIEGIGEHSVVYVLRDIKDNKPYVMKMPLTNFNPTSKYKEQLNEVMFKVKENPDEIIDLCNIILDLDPYDEVAAFDKAIGFSIKGDFNHAIESIDLAIKVNPKDVTNWFTKCQILSEAGRNEEALSTYLTFYDDNSVSVLSFMDQLGEQTSLINSMKSLLTDKNLKEKAQMVLDHLLLHFDKLSGFSKEPKPINIMRRVKENPWSPFYKSTECIRLGEEYIAPGTYYGYLLGEFMAQMNSIGYFDLDCHLGNIILNKWGGLIIVDMTPYPPRPTDSLISLAAVSLEPLFISSDSNLFHAVLCGYVTRSLITIDRQVENFTVDLLQLIGGKYESLPLVRPKNINFGKLTEFARIKWSIDSSNKLYFDVLSREYLVDLWNNKPSDVISTASYMILSGIDPSPLIVNDIQFLSPEAAILHKCLFEFTNALLSDSSWNSKEIGDLDERATLALAILRQLAFRYKYPNPPGDDSTPIPPNWQPDLLAHTVFFEFLIDPQKKQNSSFFEGFIDFNDYIISTLRTEMASNRESLKIFNNFLYGLYQLIQYSPFDIGWDAKQLRRIQYDLNSIEVMEDSLELKDMEWFASTFATLNTEGNAYFKLFKKSITSDAVRWSYIIDCIQLRLKNLRMTIDYLSQNKIENKEDKEWLFKVFMASFNGLALSVVEYSKMVRQSGDDFHSYVLTMENSVYPHLFEWVNVTMQVLQSEKYFPEGLFSCFEQFNKIISENEQ